MKKGTRKTVKSARVRLGRRTYFFDVNEGQASNRYLKITESKWMGEGKDRIVNTFFLFPGELVNFQSSLNEVAGSLSE